MNTNINTNITIRKQLFNLNNLSTDELRLKWFEFFKTNPANFKRGFIIKSLAYKIQSLSGESNVSDLEVETAIKVAKARLSRINANNTPNGEEGNNKNEIIILPPIGSIIKTIYKNKEYVVKILGENSFSYNDKIYKSLSAIASEIAGTRWSGYAFFKLKKSANSYNRRSA